MDPEVTVGRLMENGALGLGAGSTKEGLWTQLSGAFQAFFGGARARSSRGLPRFCGLANATEEYGDSVKQRPRTLYREVAAIRTQ